MTQLGIIGFGSQAQAFAHNLTKSGYEVSVLLREGSSNLARAEELGYNVMSYDRDMVPAELKILIVLTPDDTHAEILKVITKNNHRSFCFTFAHGYSFIKDELKKHFPDHEFSLLAPKAIASEVKNRFLAKEPMVGVIDTSHSPSYAQEINQVAKDMGLTKVIKSSFKDEAMADLFSEQTVLCSLLPYGALKSYEYLLSKGIDPDLAFTECWMEVKLIADAMLQHGPVGYLKLISDNAFAGGEKAQKLIFDTEYQKKLDSLWKDIEKGSFFREIDAMNMAEIKEEVIGKWASNPLQKSFNSYKSEVGNEKTTHN